MAPNPQILLMDEPFGALDHALKSELRDETKKIFKDNGTTAIIVSHDFDDAISMSDHVLIIDDGLVAQEGSAKDLIPITRNNSFKIA
jgi:ABC-type sulfate/molybdate transport systems ATPase subunit